MAQNNDVIQNGTIIQYGNREKDRRRNSPF